MFSALNSGAGDEVRTRDILNGSQILYQLSYTCLLKSIIIYFVISATVKLQHLNLFGVKGRTLTD